MSNFLRNNLNSNEMNSEKFTDMRRKARTNGSKIPYRMRSLDEEEPTFMNRHPSSLRPTEISNISEDLEVPAIEIPKNKRTKKTQFPPIDSKELKHNSQIPSQSLNSSPKNSSANDSLSISKDRETFFLRQKEIQSLQSTIVEKDKMIEELIQKINTEVKGRSKITQNKHRESSFTRNFHTIQDNRAKEDCKINLPISSRRKHIQRPSGSYMFLNNANIKSILKKRLSIRAEF